MVALCKPPPQFTEVELSPEQHAGHAAVGGISQRCFVAQVPDGELCAFVSTRKKTSNARPTWHISVSVADPERKPAIFRWPTPDEILACMALAGQGDRVKFAVHPGEMHYLVHIVEVEQTQPPRKLSWHWCLIAVFSMITFATLLAAVWR